MASVKLPAQKVILCGDYGVGKSSLFRRFTNDTFVSANDRKSTLGLDFFNKAFCTEDGHNQTPCECPPSSKVMLQLWDTGGMERVATVTSSYYKFSEAAILVYSVDNADSFNSLAQHLLEVASFAENAKIFLCGNKTDLSPDLVTSDDVDSFCEQCGIVNGIFRTSCKTGEGVPEMFNEIARVISTSSRSRHELLQLEQSFKLTTADYEAEPLEENNCNRMC